MLLDGCKEVILKHANLAYALYCERLIGVTWGCGEGGGRMPFQNVCFPSNLNP